MSGDLQLQLTGDWNRAGLHMHNIAARLRPEFEALMLSDGQFVLEKMRGHIDSQDLGWTPLTEHTIELKGGNSTILVETGALRDGLIVRRVKSSASGLTLFIGASPWKSHPSGMSMSQLMIWIEGGTSRMPPRPLIKPTIDEVKDILQSHWVDLMKEIVMG